MNIVFAVQDTREALALKNELNKLVQAAKASASPDANNLPVDLRHVTVEQAGVFQDGRVQLPDNGLFPGDIIIVDATLTGERTQEAVEDAKKRVPGVPVIILADPKDDLLAAGAGAADCIAKTENYLLKLVAIIERESRHQALKREKLETLAREKRIRLIIETLPAGVAVIAPDGTFLAVNLAGLKLLGFEKLEQAVGKNALHFTNRENQEKLQSLLEQIGDGVNASVNLGWKAPDGTTLCIRIDATPMRKQGIQGSTVLAAIHSLEDDAENSGIQKILQKSEEKLQELEKNHALQKTRWEEAIRHEESLRRETEDKQAEAQTALQESQERLSSLKTALDDSEENRDRLVKILNTERSKWNQIIQDHETALQELEGQRTALEAKIGETEALQKERSGWEEMRRELERRIREMEGKQAEVQTALAEAGSQLSAIEAALGEAEENRKKQAEEHETERSNWEQLRHTLEQKANQADERSASLESAKRAAEERNADLEAKLQNVEESRTLLETRLRESGEERANLEAKIKESEELRALLPAEERLRADLEQKLFEAEKQKAALQSALQKSEEANKSLETALKETEENQNRQTEDFKRERSGWEEIRLALENKARETEERGTSLESAKQNAEERNADLEAKLKDLQEAREALEAKLRDLRENRTRTEEMLDEERSSWEQLRHQLEKEICQLQEKQKEVQITLQQAGAQLSDIETALRESEENRRRQTEEFEAQRAGWEQSRLALEQKVRESEQHGASLEAAKRAAEERNADLEAKLKDVQETRASLEARLLEADKRERKTDEILHEERSSWEQLRLALEQKVREAEERGASLEAAKRAAEERNADLEAKLKDVQETGIALEAGLKEADAERAALKTKIEQLEQNRQAEAENLRGEISRREQRSLALEQKVRENEQQRSVLLSDLQTSEEGRSALETALQQVEEEQKNLLAQHEAEAGHWEQMQREWQNRLQKLDEQHAAHLKSTLKNEEERYRRLYEDHQANKSYIKEIQQQIADLSSDLNRLQSELVEAKNRHQRISEAPGIGVAVTTLEGLVLECNDAAAHMFGYADSLEALSSVEGKEAFHMYPFQGALGIRLQEEGLLENVEWSLLNGKGIMYRFRENVKLTQDSSGESALMERVFADITEEHRLLEEIRRMRKADPSGDAFTSAVKILKNLNESLVRYGKDLKSSAEKPETVQNIAETLERDAGRSSKYISQLIAVSSKADRISTIVDLNDILEENEEVLRNLAGEAVDLQIEGIPGGSLVAADRREMVQLILSAVVSSLKSLHLGGSISVRTENVEMDAYASGKNRPEYRSGLYVELTVSADGCEMTPDMLPAYNQAIVERLGGWYESSSDPQSGHVHQIYLPRVVAVPGGEALPSGIIELRLANGNSAKSS